MYDLFDEYEQALSNQLELTPLTDLVKAEINFANKNEEHEKLRSFYWLRLTNLFLHILSEYYSNEKYFFYQFLKYSLKRDICSIEEIFLRKNWKENIADGRTKLIYVMSAEEVGEILRQAALAYLNSLSLKERIIVEMNVPR